MQYAGFWVRAGALLIDCVLAVGLHFSSALIFGDGSPEVAAAALLVYVLYPLLMPLTKLQGTIGKAIFKIRIVSDDTGRRIKLWQAFVRYIVSWVHIPFSLLYLAVVFSGTKQAIHDFAARTYVMKTADTE
ncbi:RDD family protein [Bacillus haynesii]|uniref:RDD family protein n=1 Tax=Bacillus haynesii TaxID=1925021 RepID=UPI00227F2C4A|nr:RDD family protein [Bacillus haynesii]MCY7861720.1 RDD family protein [Bacillus haynesii]MCY7911659.1 RDD family protein [Bacillus haynesii]MCY7925662.1 RDD family protein [Bacillus haynesii]MCY8005355.1 RDD family protein [Bacillus haynesii]MCY8102145.1 RDD family protein [Bacillus haynesii]